MTSLLDVTAGARVFDHSLDDSMGNVLVPSVGAVPLPHLAMPPRTHHASVMLVGSCACVRPILDTSPGNNPLGYTFGHTALTRGSCFSSTTLGNYFELIFALFYH